MYIQIQELLSALQAIQQIGVDPANVEPVLIGMDPIGVIDHVCGLADRVIAKYEALGYRSFPHISETFEADFLRWLGGDKVVH